MKKRLEWNGINWIEWKNGNKENINIEKGFNKLNTVWCGDAVSEFRFFVFVFIIIVFMYLWFNIIKYFARIISHQWIMLFVWDLYVYSALSCRGFPCFNWPMSGLFGRMVIVWIINWTNTKGSFFYFNVR